MREIMIVLIQATATPTDVCFPMLNSEQTTCNLARLEMLRFRSDLHGAKNLMNTGFPAVSCS